MESASHQFSMQNKNFTGVVLHMTYSCLPRATCDCLTKTKRQT